MTCSDSLLDIVHTSDGPVRGVIRDGMRTWLGIPYAAPPVGNLRWCPPAPPQPWIEAYDATRFGPICAQNDSTSLGFGHNTQSEDCLYLNVYVSVFTQSSSVLPVMVWIHGGGLFQGASNDYNPQALVQHGGVVFVSLNYRVNVFGFFSHASINAEGHICGNYGIMDQQCALRWIRKNIGNFGGDCRNVTIFGESAGGLSVAAHMVSPGSAGLFHKAIIQSGATPISFALKSLQSLEGVGDALVNRAGCSSSSSAALRELSTRQLITANALQEGQFGATRFPFGLMEDGVVIPHETKQQFLRGNFARVPLMIGVTKDEFSWFQAIIELSTGVTISADEYPTVLSHSIETAAKNGLLGLKIPPAALEDILRRYPLSAYVAPGRAVAAAIGDAGLISTFCRRAARVIKSYVTDVYTYEFSVEDAPAPWPVVSFPYGAAHTQELQFLFPGFRGASGVAQPLAVQHLELSLQMVRYWTNFAKSSSPNSQVDTTSNLPFWPIYEVTQDCAMLLQTPVPIAIRNWGERHHTDFWDAFYEQEQDK